MSRDKIQEVWAKIDAKQLILTMGAIITSLIIYIGNGHVNQINQQEEKNHQLVMAEIAELKQTIKDQKANTVSRLEKVNDRVDGLDERQRDTERQVAKLEAKVEK